MAFTNLARVLKAFQHASSTLDLASGAASVTVVPAISGKSFLIRRAFLRITSESGNSTLAEVKIMCGATTISNPVSVGTSATSVNDIVEIAITGGSDRVPVVDVSSNGISVVVETAANGVLVAVAYVEGYIL